MDFRQVRYFLTLAETLNFTRAAEQCHVTQPTLTNAIKRLEEELGGELILRDGKFTRLTKLGQTLRSQFARIEETRTSLELAAQNHKSGNVSELNIGVMCTIGPAKVASFLNSFQKENSNVKLNIHDVTPCATMDLLLSGALDGALYAGDGTEHSRADHLELYKEAMVVAFPKGHKFSAQERVSLTEVADEPYIDRLHCEFRDSILGRAKENSIEMNVVFSSQREDWIQSMVRDGMGVSILPKSSLIASELECRAVSEPVIERRVDLVTIKELQELEALSILKERAAQFHWISG